MGGGKAGERRPKGKSVTFEYDGVPPRPSYPNAPGDMTPPAAAPAVRSGLPFMAQPLPPADPRAQVSMADLERIYTMVNATFQQVYLLQSQQFTAEQGRQSEHYRAMLEVARGGQQTAGVATALKELAVRLDRIDGRLRRVEEEEEEEEAPAAAPKGKFSDRMLDLLGNLVEQFGEDAVLAGASRFKEFMTNR